MGTTTTMSEALFNTVLGIGTVFIMLIVMSIIIYCFRIIPKLQKAFAKKGAQVQPAIEAAPVPEISTTQNLTDDMELVAVIAAAIAASEEIPLDSFRVRTIKRRR